MVFLAIKLCIFLRAGAGPVLSRGFHKRLGKGLSNNMAIKIFNYLNMKILWRYRLLFCRVVPAIVLCRIACAYLHGGRSLSIIHPLVPGTVRDVVVARSGLGE
jgi:hypothetical protein